LCLPILKQITKKENRNILKYLIILLFIFGGFNRIFDYLFNVTISYTIVFGEFLIYFILGYYLNTFDISKKNTKLIYAFGIIGLVITLFGTIISSKANGITDVFFKYDTFNVILYSSSVFLFAKNNFVRFNEKVLKILTQTNFGVYLIHGLILGFFEYIGLFGKIANVSIALSVLLNSIIIYLMSTLCVYVLIKIPYIRKLVSL
jgi:surface polysaccharide O-acyltransferase-like enzyme